MAEFDRRVGVDGLQLVGRNGSDTPGVGGLAADIFGYSVVHGLRVIGTSGGFFVIVARGCRCARIGGNDAYCGPSALRGVYRYRFGDFTQIKLANVGTGRFRYPLYSLS